MTKDYKDTDEYKQLGEGKESGKVPIFKLSKVDKPLVNCHIDRGRMEKLESSVQFIDKGENIIEIITNVYKKS